MRRIVDVIRLEEEEEVQEAEGLEIARCGAD